MSVNQTNLVTAPRSRKIIVSGPPDSDSPRVTTSLVGATTLPTADIRDTFVRLWSSGKSSGQGKRRHLILTNFSLQLSTSLNYECRQQNDSVSGTYDQ